MTPEVRKVISQSAQSGSVAGACLYLMEVTLTSQPWASKGPQWVLRASLRALRLGPGMRQRCAVWPLMSPAGAETSVCAVCTTPSAGCLRFSWGSKASEFYLSYSGYCVSRLIIPKVHFRKRNKESSHLKMVWARRQAPAPALSSSWEQHTGNFLSLPLSWVSN